MTRTRRPIKGPKRADSGAPSRSGGLLAAVAIALWFLVALLLSLTQIHDRDFGFHVAWGRLLFQDFGSVRALTLGQDPSSLLYAYSYWLYQLAVAGLFDRVGPWGVVLLRAAMLLAAFGLAFALARRSGASPWAGGIALALGVAIARERFVDRPDVFSHLAWVVALWILCAHRHGRGVWALVPLQALWVNTHLYWSLLLPLAIAFFAADALQRRGDARRAARVIGLLVVATLANPLGPAVWATQLHMASFVGPGRLPFPIRELVGAYAGSDSFLALWAFRVGMPLSLLVAALAWRKVGLGPLAALLLAAGLGALAIRAMSLFGVTVVAVLPVALDRALGRLPRPTGRAARIGASLAAAALGLAAVGGLLTNRLYLAQDKQYRIGGIGHPRFAATEAARFLRRASVAGPIFHNPTAAGAILMENGTRVTPFLDPRWNGTPAQIATYHEMTRATDASAADLWRRAEAAFGFEAVMLDCYEMPALLRHVAAHPDWAMVFLDGSTGVFCRRGGENQPVIDRFEPEVLAARATPDPGREAALGAAVVRFHESPGPSLFASLEFPAREFHAANLALQLGRKDDAQAAYVELLRRERGSLRASPRRADVLGNVLWCLGGTDQWAAIAALCEELSADRKAHPGHLRALRRTHAYALTQLGRRDEAAALAERITADAGATAEDRWWAWVCLADARSAGGDDAAALEALRAAARALPRAADTYRAIGDLLDQKLRRPGEALEAYVTYQRLGGRDSVVERRIARLRLGS